VTIDQDFEIVWQVCHDSYDDTAEAALSRIKEVVEAARVVSATWALRPAALREIEK
jgi:hypothetical protein